MLKSTGSAEYFSRLWVLEETQIEFSFCAAINTAREQKSVSREKQAEASYGEYRRQKASASGGRGFRLPLR